MFFEMTQPVFLFGLLAVGWLILFWRRSLVDMSVGQRLLSLAVRTLVLSLLILALTGLTLRVKTKEKMVAFLSDRSLSIDETARIKCDEFLTATGMESNKTSFVRLEFAASPRAVTKIPAESQKESQSTNAAGNSPAEDKSETDSQWTRATNIAAALEYAAAELSPQKVGEIVLLSDGNETQGDALATARTLGIPVSTVLLPGRDLPEVQLAAVVVPAETRQGEPFMLETIVRTNREGEGTITIYRGDFKVLEEKKLLKKGENRFFFRQTLSAKRQELFTATVDSANDTLLDNNKASNIVYVGGRPRVLVIDDDAKSVRPFVSALKRQDLDLDIRPVEGLPKSLENLENYDVLFLSNVSAVAMTKRQMDLLTFYVRDLGGGLIVSGGDHAFGLGGYYKTPLDELLPVRSRFEKEKEKPSLAMALVIDRSGSMGGEKIAMARDAAKSAVELLTSRDSVSVIAFDHECYPVVPMQTVSASGSIIQKIGTIEAAGGTNIYPALVEACQQLDRSAAALKHIILLTDGYSEPGDYDSIIQQMTSRRITLSTVGVGNADNDLLTRLASSGKGRHYVCENPSAIPQVFARETTLASKSAITEEPFVPLQTTATDVLSGIDLNSAPPLLGYVKTRGKPTSQIILTTEKGEPLLSWWRYGLGMAVAYTSDIKNRWGAEWLSWPDNGVLWAPIVRHAMRKSDAHGSSVLLQPEEGKIRLILDSLNEHDAFNDRGQGVITSIAPDLTKTTVPLSQTAPGRYEAVLDLSQRGGYHFQWILESGGKQIVSQSRGYFTGYPKELRIADPNRELMRQIAEETGGAFNPSPDSVFQRNDRFAWRIIPLWPWLLAAALVSYVLDVLLRRVDFFSSVRIPSKIRENKP